MQRIAIKLIFNIRFPEAQIHVQSDNSCAVCFSDFFWEQPQLTLIKTAVS